MRDEFLSEEDLDLSHLSWGELLAWWQHWLEQAQVTNDSDTHLYSHGVFEWEPGHEDGKDAARGAERLDGMDHG